MPQPGEDQQLPQCCFSVWGRQTGHPLDDLPDRVSMVPQSGQNRNYIIPNRRAFQQAFAIQGANVDSFVSEENIRSAEFAFHSKRRLADIEQDLVREPPEQPKDAEGVLGHSQCHGRVV